MNDANPDADTDSESTTLIGAADYDADRTKTCRQCDETTAAAKWDQTGPTYQSEGIQLATMARCPACGTIQ